MLVVYLAFMKHGNALAELELGLPGGGASVEAGVGAWGWAVWEGRAPARPARVIPVQWPS